MQRRVAGVIADVDVKQTGRNASLGQILQSIQHWSDVSDWHALIQVNSCTVKNSEIKVSGQTAVKVRGVNEHSKRLTCNLLNRLTITTKRRYVLKVTVISSIFTLDRGEYPNMGAGLE